MANILLFNKPYDVLSQFTDDNGRQTLGDFISFKDYYPAGRLDRDSEGLLLLTDDGRLQHLISHPRHKMKKTYWAQVEGIVDEHACGELMSGVELKDGPARALSAKPMAPPDIWPRVPPVRERKSVPDSWLELVIDEGRNRQVRRMTAAAGFPTLRLIRYSIGEWTLDGIAQGEFRKVSPGKALLEELDSARWKPRTTDRPRRASNRNKKTAVHRKK